MTKRKKSKKERRPPPVAASRRRALAERWAALAEGWLDAVRQGDGESLASEARSLAGEAGAPHAFGEAFKRAEPSRAEGLLNLAAAAGAGELASALQEILRRPLAAGLALGASEALVACGGRPEAAFQEALGLAEEVAAKLIDTLEATGEPEAIVETASPLEGLDEAPAVAALLEVFGRLSADGWLGASRLAGRSFSLDSALVAALEAAALPGAEAVALLKRLARSEVKATSKGARALLYRLKSRGVAVEEEAEAAVWSPPAAEAEPGEALLTGFDQAGHRMVWLALPAPGRGLNVGYGIVSDVDGLLSFTWGTMPRKKISEVKEELAEEHARRQIPLVSVEPDEAARRLAAAAEGGGREVPEDYRSFVRLHPPPPVEAGVSVYEAIPPEAVERARHSTSASPSLLDDLQAGVAFWRIEADAVARAVEPAEEKRLIIAPSAPKAAEAEELAGLCDRLFTGELFGRLLARLEEQAFVLWADGQQDRASLCLACVLPFRDDPLMRPSDHPFWRLWAERLLEAHKASAQRAGAEDRLIVTPEEAAAEAEAARRRFMPGRRRRG